MPCFFQQYYPLINACLDHWWSYCFPQRLNLSSPLGHISASPVFRSLCWKPWLHIFMCNQTDQCSHLPLPVCQIDIVLLKTEIKILQSHTSSNRKWFLQQTGKKTVSQYVSAASVSDNLSSHGWTHNRAHIKTHQRPSVVVINIMKQQWYHQKKVHTWLLQNSDHRVHQYPQ